MSIYSRVLNQTLRKNQISRTDRILIVCAVKADRNIFESEGFEHVTISNLDFHHGVKDYSPYPWELQDAENI